MANFEALVLSGGGIKALCQLGALHYYDEQSRLDEITEYAGTSAGSVVNLLLVCGYKPMEIMKEIYTMSNFLSSPPSEDATQSSPHNISQIITSYGLLSIQPFVKIIEDLVIKKMGKVPTFLELKNMTNKILIVPIANLSREKIVYVSYKNKPNWKVTKAVCISCNLPFIFHCIEEDGEYYADGGLGDNFPIEAIRRDRNTLGIVTTVIGRYAKLPMNVMGFMTYLYRVISFPINYNTHLRSKNIEGVTLIKINSSANVITISPTNVEKMELFMKGYKDASITDRGQKLIIPQWRWDEDPNDGWDVDFPFVGTLTSHS